MKKGIFIVVASLFGMSCTYGDYNYGQPNNYMAYAQPQYGGGYTQSPSYYQQPQSNYQYPKEYYTGLPQQYPDYNPQPAYQPQQQYQQQRPQYQGQMATQQQMPQQQGYAQQPQQQYQQQQMPQQQYRGQMPQQGYAQQQPQYQGQYQQPQQQQYQSQPSSCQQRQQGGYASNDEPKKENSASVVNKITRFMADQLSKNRDFENITKSKIAVVSFVTSEDLSKTNKLGRMISENMVHDLQIRGYDVLDFKTAVAIEVSDEGAFIFSSDSKKLKTKQNINFVVSGTMDYYSDGVTVNARIVQLKDNKVVSTAQAFIPNDTVAEILDTLDPYMAFHSRSSMSTVRITPE